MAHRTIRLLLLTCVLVAVGCEASKTTRGTGPYHTIREENRDPYLAQQLNMRAASLLETDPEEAKRLLGEALTADIYFGPAHNNLGVLHLQQGRLYEAANEFEWARKLMPGHPDPRMNLAMTLERAGRIEDALATYRTAIEVYPEHMPSIQAMTRLELRHHRTTESTYRNLGLVALRGESSEWRDWARFQMSKWNPSRSGMKSDIDYH